MKTTEIGMYLRQLRESQGLTMRELDKRSGVSHSYISQIERGERAPSSEILLKLAGPLGVTPAKLMVKAGLLDFWDLVNLDESDPVDAVAIHAIQENLTIQNNVTKKEIGRVELVDLLNQSNITYNSHPLDEDDRKRILDMLAVLFPDRE